MAMTFDEWRVARKLVEDLSPYSEYASGSGYVYPGGLVIERRWGESWHLQIANHDWLGLLPELERILYDWWLTECN